MSRNESRNETVYTVSVSMTVKIIEQSTHSSNQKNQKPFVTGRILRCPQDFLAPSSTRLLLVVESNTNLGAAVKEF